MALAMIGFGGGATGAAAVSTVEALAGRYHRSFPNALVSGEKYCGQDRVEITPIDAAHAYVEFELDFYNGHNCGLSGVATAQGDALVYVDPEPLDPDRPPCTLTIRRNTAQLTWDDQAGTCSGYCGARGSFSHGQIPWRSRRKVAADPTLISSDEYKQALDAWRRKEGK